MSIVSFCSLKGGVGKTSLSVNVAHALSLRGHETLFIDSDPSAHATKFFSKRNVSTLGTAAPLTKYILSEPDGSAELPHSEQAAEALGMGIPVKRVRERLAILPGGEEFRHFMWGRGAKLFHHRFPRLLSELGLYFDRVVIDTAPEFNVVTRTVLASSDVVIVPVDSSSMSLDGLESLVENAAHITRPTWSIVRAMVDRRAHRVRRLAHDALAQSIEGSKHRNSRLGDDSEAGMSNPADAPIYLLNSIVFRTEYQNYLSFLGQTAFEQRVAARLAADYGSVAGEVEHLLRIRLEGAAKRPADEMTVQFA